jgi:fructose-bisphosphate aldolase class 1
MKRGRPPKPDPLDLQPRPPAEELFDQTTVQKLDKLQVPEVEDPMEDIESKLEKLPEDRRKEASKALKSRFKRMRSYIYHGEEDEVW